MEVLEKELTENLKDRKIEEKANLSEQVRIERVLLRYYTIALRFYWLSCKLEALQFY